MPNPFDTGATETATYDAWYDTEAGSAVLAVEVDCLRAVLGDIAGPRLEVGAGTGRFAQALGAAHTVDPAPEMLRLAAARHLDAVRGVAEALPYRDAIFDAVICVTALEFVARPHLAIAEVARVLRPGGRFALGYLPRDGAWATVYARTAAANPASVFHRAHFFTPDEITALCRQFGLAEGESRSALFAPPDQPVLRAVRHGVDASAGFVATAFTRT